MGQNVTTKKKKKKKKKKKSPKMFQISEFDRIFFSTKDMTFLAYRVSF